MNKLDTYNRVKDLQAPYIKVIISACYFLMITTFFIAGISALLVNDYWPYSLYLLVGTVLMFVIVFSYDRKRIGHCQFCGGYLSDTARPFILSTRYLSTKGIKDGYYFYTQRARMRNLFRLKWVKISNLSLTCHHCRLTEEKHREHIENVNPEELSNIQHKKI